MLTVNCEICQGKDNPCLVGYGQGHGVGTRAQAEAPGCHWRVTDVQGCLGHCPPGDRETSPGQRKLALGLGLG